MEQLKRLIQEIHRRSLWQVLAIYVGASWVVFEIVQTVTEGLGLPLWFPPFAALLLLIGLPLVLATAFVQQGLSPTRGEDPTLMPATETESAGGQEAGPGVRSLFTWRNVIAGGVVALAVWGIAAAGWLVFGPEAGTEAASGESGDAATPSIAVLPLQNMVGTDPEQEYFVVGLTDVLISELSKIHGLVVKSHSSVMRYRDERPPTPEIGRQLGADYLIEGSVARGEHEVRVTIQLIEAEEDRHVWAENYRRPLAEYLKLQEEVARAIAGEIKLRLEPTAREPHSAGAGLDSVTLEAYLKGRYYLGRYAQDNQGADIRSSISYLRQAVERQPDWAQARALLARADHFLGSGGGGREYYDSAKAMARSALDLDPNLALAHAALGFARLYGDLDWSGAEVAYERALQLDPNSYHWGYAIYLLAAGRYADAVASYRRAEERDPFNNFLKAQLGFAYVCADQPNRAIEYLLDLLRLYPDHPGLHASLGAAYVKRGEHDPAVAEYERAAAGGGFRRDLGYAYAMSGARSRAREIREELEREGNTNFPALLLALGEADAALRQLERAYEARGAAVLFIRCPPFLGIDLTRAPGLRDAPRFQALLERIDFPD